MAVLSDETIVHLAKLSNLNFTPGTPEFIKVKSDVGRLVGMVQNLQAELPKVQLSTSARHALAKADAALQNETYAQHRLDELRKDDTAATDPSLCDELLGQPDKVVQHASVRYGQYFKVPKVIDE